MPNAWNFALLLLFVGSVPAGESSTQSPTAAKHPSTNDVRHPRDKAREWTLRNGRTIQATCEAIRPDRTIRLRMRSGVTHTTPLAQLSNADLDFLVGQRLSCEGYHTFLVNTSRDRELAEVSSGADDGLRPGGVWTVRRGPIRFQIRGRSFVVFDGRPVARIRILQVAENHAIARRLTGQLRVGDFLAYELKPKSTD